jgi:WXXGXW repeat (2 copies)
MTPPTKALWTILGGCCYLGVAVPPATAQNPPDSPPVSANAQVAGPDQDAAASAANGPIEPLVRGPIHEGYAEMMRLTPQPIPPIAGEPPQPINEAPADVRPDDPNAEWIPGYWGWDGESKRFIWVSGTWRVPPPGTRWVPGYWTQTAQGSQRVPGFWISADTEQVNYLPAPPAYEDEGVDPNSPPSPDVFWVPGTFVFTNGNYNFEPGYWARAVQNWVWVAAHYQWTPQGYVFIDGRWDYPLDNRGMLFSPVAFNSPVYQQNGFVYNPDYVIDSQLLADNLFVDPTYQDYYFGDYYGSQYQQAGIYPWYSVGTGAYLYDPIFAYRSWFDRRHNVHWRDDLRRRFDRMVHDPAARPPRTWRDEQRLARTGPGGVRYRPLVRQIDQAMRDNQLGRHSVRLNDVQRRQAQENSALRRRLAQDRSRLERPPGAPRGAPPAQGRPNPVPPRSTFHLPPVRALERTTPEEREQVRPGTARNRVAEPRVEPRREVRPEPRPEMRAPAIEQRRPAAPQQERLERPEPRIAQPPRRPERVMGVQRPAPAVRRPAPAAPRQEKRP